MKRIYEVVIETERETATRTIHVVSPNTSDAGKRAMAAYKRRRHVRLFGRPRITRISEIGPVG